MDTATEVKNQKTLLRSLKNDIIAASTLLSEKYAELKEVNKKVDKASDELLAHQLASDAVSESLSQEKAIFKKAEQDAANAVKRSEAELKVIKDQKKEALKELKRLNEWIHTAKAEQKALKGSITKLNKSIDRKKGFIDDIEQYEQKAEQARTQYQSIMQSCFAVQDETELKVHKSNEQLKKNEAQLAKIKQELADAKEELKKAKRESQKKYKDLSIYADRVEKQYEKAFPGRTIKI